MLLPSVLCHGMYQRCVLSKLLTCRMSQARCLTTTILAWSSHQRGRRFASKLREDRLDLTRLLSTDPQVQHLNPFERWTRTVIKACLLTCSALGLLLAGLTYMTIQNINKTLSVFRDKQQDDHWLYPYLNFDKQAWLIPWLQLYRADLATLLELCHSDDRNKRQLGVKGLAAVDGWPDWEYYLASMLIDTRTLIGLARTKGANQKLFPRPPSLLPFQDNVLSQLKRLLLELPTEDIDKCTNYFRSAALKAKPRYRQEKTMMWMFDDNDFLQLEPVTSDNTSQSQQLLVLLALDGYCRTLSHSVQIVKNEGLELLRRLYETCKHDMKIAQHIACILSYLTQYEVLHSDIAESGWVTIFADWINSDNFPLSVYAAKALANLDRDYGEHWLYPDSVYLYYPHYRSTQPINADVVFIHGLLGGPFRTWRQNDCMKPERRPDARTSALTEVGRNNDSMKDSGQASSIQDEEGDITYTVCWPKDWLASDCPNLRILTVDYETYLSEWSPKCPYENERRTLLTRSKELLAKLQASGLGSRPIIWVAHSMGGLLVKQMLLLASQDNSLADVVQQTKGILFYSVPHKGSPLSVYMSRTKYLLYPSAEVRLLYQGSKELLELHKRFKSLISSTRIPLLSFGEGTKTNLPFNVRAMFVPVESSDPGFGEFHLMKKENHLTICKPVNKESALYQQTLRFITRCCPECQRQETSGNNLWKDQTIPER